MSQPFPADEPFLSGYYAPLHFEAEAYNLPITGEVPKALNGTLYRNGPNPQFAPRGPYHWFFGDGMLHAFTLGNGRVHYRNRWVRTPKWQLEHEVGEGLSGLPGHPQFNDSRVVELGSTLANTNIIWHGERLLALEEAHAPFEVDPHTLAAIGYHNFDNRLVGPMTAHPKFDPVNGEMIFFGYAAKGRFTPDFAVHTVDREGNLLRSRHFEAPFASMVHDFVVTRKYIVMPIFPLTSSMDRAKKGFPAYAWEPEKGTHVAVIPRDGKAGQIRWFDAPAGYVFHPMNGFDTEDGKLICDMQKYEHAPLFPKADGTPVAKYSPEAKLVRWTFDLNSKARSFKEDPLDDHSGEFPRFDERFAMLEYRHGYFNAAPATAATQGREARAGLAHIDLKTRNTVLWQPPLGDYCGEPIFVPRDAKAAEGDGWILSVIFRGAENRSDLAVFDAGQLSAGPIALVHLSHRVPAGFHGNWRGHG